MLKSLVSASMSDIGEKYANPLISSHSTDRELSPKSMELWDNKGILFDLRPFHDHEFTSEFMAHLMCQIGSEEGIEAGICLDVDKHTGGP